MTEKEKAKELVDKFLPEIKSADRYNYNLESLNFFISKRCAIIAIDEILKNFGLTCNGKMFYTEYRTIEYWQQVKKEIEKLVI